MNKEIQVVKGWATSVFGGTLHYLHSTKDEYKDDQIQATLIIGDNAIPISEVVKMLREMRTAMRTHEDINYKEYVTLSQDSFEDIIDKYNISI